MFNLNLSRGYFPKSHPLKQSYFQQTHSPLIRLSLLLSVTASFSICATLPQFLAQPVSAQQVAQTPQTVNAPTHILYVSPATGNDSSNGSQQSPLRTITQALSLAKPNTAILLAAGTYSTQTGEQFPLIVPPNVTLQGNPNTQGKEVVIYGGGFFTSRIFAKQNIGILGANGARISGVTITNPNSRGYGLWIESTSMIVSNNTFTESSHDGISIVGSSAPLIQDNSFTKNGANGITVYGSSRPEIRKNDFQDTGFGINIAQNAAPFITENRITYNKDGIVIQANAQPILRDNYIERNQRDGIVAIAQALPDIGTASEPGRNVIRNNGRYDVNNGTQRQVIQAYGNQLASNKTKGSVAVAGNYNAPPPPSPIAQQLTARRTRNNPSATSPINAAAALPVFVPESTPQPQPTASTPPPSRSRAIPIPVPPPQTQTISSPPPTSRNTTSNPAEKPLILSNLARNSSSSRNSSNAIPIPVPPPESRQPTRSYPFPQQSAPASSGNILPVPGSNIPTSGRGYVPPGLQTGPAASSSPRRLTPITTALLGLRYRVVVEGNSERLYRRVRSVVPDAFRANIQGRSVIQAGAFQNRSKANQVLRRLTRNGIPAKLESYN